MEPAAQAVEASAQRARERVGTKHAGYNFKMIPDTIKEKLAQQPFEPFVIRASSGQAYKVSSPDLIVLMKTKVFVAEPRSDRAATLPYLHIAAIEEPGNGNGHPRRKRSR